LCDLIEERLNRLGDEIGVSARFTDLDEMIRQTEPDIVAIPTGTEFHYDLSMRVLEHGVHIDVEKPMGVDLLQADAVLAKAKQKGVQVAVHHQWRVSAWAQAVAQVLQAGKIGDLRYIYASGKGYYGGYGLLNIGTHLLNHMIKFGGHCRSVAAQATTDGRPIMPQDVLLAPAGMGTIAGEHITATLQFDNDVTGTLLQHRFKDIDLDAHVVELYGSEGRLMWHPYGAWWLPHPHARPGGDDRWQALEPIYPATYDILSENDRQSLMYEGDYWFVEEYVRALDEGRAHECSGVEGQHVIEIMMGIFESAIYGTRVTLPQANRDHPLLRWRSEAGLGEPEPMPRAYPEWLAAEDKRLGR
jgi:predicted dehydrogenase